MIFSNTSKYDINIEINDIKIKRVTQDKCLGVLIDEKLTWAAHKVAIAKKYLATVEYYPELDIYLTYHH